MIRQVRANGHAGGKVRPALVDGTGRDGLGANVPLAEGREHLRHVPAGDLQHDDVAGAGRIIRPLGREQLIAPPDLLLDDHELVSPCGATLAGGLAESSKAHLLEQPVSLELQA